MFATELRIGNLLQKSNGEVFTIKRLDHTNDVLVNEESGLLTLGYNLVGIPLTKEWLKKFGIELHRKHYSMNLGRELFEYVDFQKTRYCLWDAGGLGWTLDETIRNETTKFIKYVHELQNLYFVLTGEELKLK